MSDDDGKDSNISYFPGNNVRVEYTDHEMFLDIVKDGIKDRPMLSTVVLCLDKNGHLTMHSSTGNTERVIALLAQAQRHSVDMWGEVLLSQLESEGDDDSQA